MRIHFRAESLSKETNMTVILPEKADVPYFFRRLFQQLPWPLILTPLILLISGRDYTDYTTVCRAVTVFRERDIHDRDISADQGSGCPDGPCFL